MIKTCGGGGHPAGTAALAPVLTERSRRVWAATEAQAIGYGGTALVARATGIATSTIQRGLRELTADEPLAGGRTRRAGGGRKRAIDLDATLLRDLDALVEPTAPGDARRCGGRARAHGRWRWRSTVWATASATRWSPSCCTDWATACRATQDCEGRRSIGTRSFGTSPGACDARNATAADDFGGHPSRVQERGPHLAPGEDASGEVHDFVIPATATTGKAIPYVYDLHRNAWVSVGMITTPRASRYGHLGGSIARRIDESLLITADAGATGRASDGNCSVWPIVGGDHGLSLPGTSCGPRSPVVPAIANLATPHCLDRVRSAFGRSTAANTRVASPSRCAAGDGTPRAASLSRRLELHDPSRCSENTKVSNCLTSPKHPCTRAPEHQE